MNREKSTCSPAERSTRPSKFPRENRTKIEKENFSRKTFFSFQTEKFSIVKRKSFPLAERRKVCWFSSVGETAPIDLNSWKIGKFQDEKKRKEKSTSKNEDLTKIGFSLSENKPIWFEAKSKKRNSFRPTEKKKFSFPKIEFFRIVFTRNDEFRRRKVDFFSPRQKFQFEFVVFDLITSEKTRFLFVVGIFLFFN